ncbi:MAG: TAT-variant-translocated molybdopterin oxidoreductase [Planctomycetota bacterium]
MPSLDPAPISSWQASSSAGLYWRSLDELAGRPEFRALLEREFGAVEPDLLSSASRREFLKLLGASLALVGLTSCRWPEEVIVPFASHPEGRTPGIPVRYATAWDISGAATGLLATSFDGRPIKVDGNPSHAQSRGGSNVQIQASLLELYDPDRSRSVVYRDPSAAGAGQEGEERSWSEFATVAKALFVALRGRKGRGLRVLAEASSSPSRAALSRRFLELHPEARWYEYEPLSWDTERDGTTLLFGKPWRAQLHVARADVIASFESDFLFDHPSALRNAREFAERRDLAGSQGRNGPMSRLWCAESTFSVTGAAADERLPISSFATARAVALLAAELFVRHGLEPPGVVGATIRRHFESLDEPIPWVRRLAGDLMQHRGRSLVVAGPRQPAEVHAMVHLINAALGNVGATLTYVLEPDPSRPSHAQAITDLVREMRDGQVNTLVMLGGNPVYDAPSDLEFEKHLASVANSIHLSLFRNETSRGCVWHVPRAHYLESWDDVRAWDHTYSVVQPLIEPLYGGKTPAELLALLTGDELQRGYDIVRRTFKEELLAAADGFEEIWRRTLHDGLLEKSGFAPEVPPLSPRAADPPSAEGHWVVALAQAARSEWAVRAVALDLAPQTLPEAPRDLEIVFCRDAKVHDGRFANNGWLQEVADPLTKLTWDNAALLHPVLAERLGVTTGDIVRLELDGRAIEVPAYVMPGQAVTSVALSLGYGRRCAGRVGSGVGADAYALRSTQAMAAARGLSITRTAITSSGRVYPLALTQDHHAIDTIGERGRDQRLGELVREGTLAEYLADPHFATRVAHHAPGENGKTPGPAQLWEGHSYDTGHRWGMAIDLNACIGCNACVVACQAENNIPVVGRDEVRRGREMHWIRIDRYFRGRPEESGVQVVHQPVTCHHCENAPCEQVCPVAATVHSKEGLNEMVYNRCVGTRYCSNNCPYKVRRFNWFLNHKQITATEKMALNPEVTVRSRGVMEKCTFCVQRIMAVKIQAKNERRAIRDGEITPACAQACPTQAIVFGDLNDKESRVAKLHQNNRAYAMLEELFVKPRTKYLARLRNPAAGEQG